MEKATFTTPMWVPPKHPLCYDTAPSVKIFSQNFLEIILHIPDWMLPCSTFEQDVALLAHLNFNTNVWLNSFSRPNEENKIEMRWHCSSFMDTFWQFYGRYLHIYYPITLKYREMRREILCVVFLCYTLSQ